MDLDDELATSVMLSPTRNLSRDGEIVRRWMEMVLGDKFAGDLPAALRSGELLCDLVNKLYKALGMKSQISPVRGDKTSGCEADADTLSNVLEYIRACEVLGVLPQDLFQPDDLLQAKDMEKVYSNVLSLQAVAVSLSNRRSIDERSSMINASDWSPMLEQSVFIDEEDLEVDYLDVESPDAITLMQQSRWQRLLFEYEHQLQRKEESDRAGDSSATEGLGPLAHGIWRTEERIRGLLLCDDYEFGAVPDELHGKLWMLASGAQMEMMKHRGQYERLLAAEMESTESTRQIDVDLHRTVADGDKEQWSEEKSRMMRRILVAYSFYNPDLGYCQGLNYIVARSLQFLDEEEAFFLLVQIVKLVPDDYYTTMLGLAVDQHVFADLVRIQYPEVSERLTELGGSGMELSLACTEWFLTLFASPCEREVTFPIWDAFFLQGDEVLFRVALALLQQARAELISCNTYGDMLKHLNELGREGVDALTLMKVSKKQDCVIRGRIEDFRAHHRLQLASGIVASTVEAEDARSSTTGRRSSESRSEPRLRIFGNRKNKQGLFRHIDKIPPRLARTFDRHLTEEYIETLRQEHPNPAKYYERMQLRIEDDYWGSGESYRQWGARNFRRIATDGFTTSSHEVEDCRMKSDPNVIFQPTNSNGVEAGENAFGKRLTRERRSKSSAFLHARAAQNIGGTNIPNSRLGKANNDDDGQIIGRSPLAWIQRFEEWHKDMKNQKEKRKAEKKRQRRTQRSESVFPGMRSGQVDAGPSSWLRDAIDSSPLPLPSQPNKSQANLVQGFSLNNRRNSNEHQRGGKEKGKIEEPSLSRSFSDPFRSPVGPTERRSTQDNVRHDTKSWQGSMPPQHTSTRDNDAYGVPQKPDLGVRKLTQSGSVRDSRGLSDQSTLSRSTNSYANTASLSLENHDETSSNCSSEGKNSKQLALEQSCSMTNLAHSPAQELMHSPIHARSISMDFQGEMLHSRAPPLVRRNTSVPVNDTLAQQPRLCHFKRSTTESSQTIRERANVVQYMNRKASDASSIAGSIPRTPRDRIEVARMSGSSSESSRFGDHGSNRSGRYRKSSFSFFDKLSSDLESCADSLDSPNEFSTESNGRGSISSVATGRSDGQRSIAIST